MNVSVAVQTDHGLMVPVVKVDWLIHEHLDIFRIKAMDLLFGCNELGARADMTLTMLFFCLV